MVIRTDAHQRVPEVHAEGTITAGSRFTIDLDLAGIDRLTAIRVDALPKDAAAALKIPEDGFVLSHLLGEVIASDRSKRSKSLPARGSV
jgi:hypothetical protein